MKKIRDQTKIPKISCILSFLFFSPFIFSLAAIEPNRSSPEQTTEKLSSSQEEEISNWEARLELARVLSYLKKYEESLQEYRTLLQSKPDSVIARVEMAKVLFYYNKTDEALAELSKIPPQELDDASWLMMADIYRKKKDYSLAENIYIQYLKKFPQEDRVRLKLAELLSWQKRYEESIHHYRLILSRRPEDIQVRRRYAQVLTWAGEDEEAVKEWKRTLK